MDDRRKTPIELDWTEMDLKTATSFLLVGLFTTVLLKAVDGLFPTLAGIGPLRVVFSFLWVLAALTIVLFAYRFLEEVRPHDKGLRYSLSAVILLTGAVILTRFLVWAGAGASTTHRLLFDVFRALNSIAVVATLVFLLRRVSTGSSLRTPLQWSVLACGLHGIMALLSTGLFMKYYVTAAEVEPWRGLPVLSTAVGLLAFSTIVWFLVLVRRLDDYSVFMRG